MTEKQGGTDVRANRTTAERVGEGIYRLSGHKWFLSAPMSDGFVMLAQMGDGMGCFLVPRYLEDGSKNGLHFQRLKDKLGNRSNASAEVEFTDAFGYLLGDPGSGIRTILDMVTLTRLDCALASSGMMRASLAEAVHFARGRSVFGKMLVSQPIMTRVLADMALDVAAATALSFRLATAFDAARNNPAEAAYARVMTPIVKYWCCKIAPALIYEAMECLGGNGYVEERPIARHYREAPVNAIWEGSGNVMALDVLRVLQRGKDLFDLVFQTLERDSGQPARRPPTCCARRSPLPNATKERPASWWSSLRLRPLPPSFAAWVPARSPMPSSKPVLRVAGGTLTACSIPASIRTI